MEGKRKRKRNKGERGRGKGRSERETASPYFVANQELHSKIRSISLLERWHCARANANRKDINFLLMPLRKDEGHQ